MNEKETHKYDDIIHLPHPTSEIHPRMSLYDRAAQFSPFAALTGYEDAIEETARQTERKIRLDEDEKAMLDQALLTIEKTKTEDSEVSITYFIPDEKKRGGRYETVTGQVKKIDRQQRVLVMVDGTKIPVDDVVSIEQRNNGYL